MSVLLGILLAALGCSRGRRRRWRARALMMLGAPESTAAGAMSAMFDDASWRSAEPVTAPVLGVLAANSQIDDSEAMKTVFPNAAVQELPGTGHFLMLEKPAEFNKLLGDFLATIR